MINANYLLSCATDMEVNLPKGMDNIIIPRASINARVKQKRTSKILEDLMNLSNGSTISLDEIMDFQ